MKVTVNPGTYVVAVSGGVDSMVLLDLLAKTPKLKLIVAHYNHGIREDSDLDRKIVQDAASKYKLPFVFDEGKLGQNSSEALARDARYTFLNKIKEAAQANAIITAHHEDDMLETAVINLLRGTYRHGVTSLKSKPELLRPLLHTTKEQIKNYAKENKINWREDYTNEDDKYFRNHVRNNILPRFSLEQKNKMLEHIDTLRQLNETIDRIVSPAISDKMKLDRHWFTMLNHDVAKDIMAMWLNAHGAKDVNSKNLELLVQAAKTYEPGKKIDVDKNFVLRVQKEQLALLVHER